MINFLKNFACVSGAAISGKKGHSIYVSES